MPCFDAAETLEEVLSSVERSTRPPDEVICVNDGSTDRTGALLDKLAASRTWLRVVHLPANRGAATARNIGALASVHPLVVFLDADVVVMPDTLERLVCARATSGSVAAVALYQLRNRSSGLLACTQALIANDVFSHLPPDDFPYFGTQCSIVERSRFVAAGGFNEMFRAATVEDLEIGFRMRDKSDRISLASEAHILHARRYTVASFTRNYFVKARDLTALSRQMGRPMIASGYSSPSNTGAAVLSVLLGAGAIDAARRHRARPLMVVLPTVPVLALLWRTYCSRAFRTYGPAFGASAVALRLYATLVGVAGALSGLVGSRSSRQHRRVAAPRRGIQERSYGTLTTSSWSPNAAPLASNCEVQSVPEGDIEPNLRGDRYGTNQLTRPS